MTAHIPYFRHWVDYDFRSIMAAWPHEYISSSEHDVAELRRRAIGSGLFHETANLVGLCSRPIHLERVS